MARLGDYELIDRFATGGVAEIYRARHVRTGEIVVIKRMRTDQEFDPEHQAGFLRELQVALLANHKNLIRGLAKGAVNGVDYGVLELIDGPDLAHLLVRARQRRAPFSEAIAAYIAREMLDGLAFAYALRGPDGKQMGLVHRDLAPKNVFLTSSGGVRIGDFGAALASMVERVGDVVGSPGYMSPEQAAREPLDHRSDMYAVGLILFELLSSTPAFDTAGKTPAQVLKLHHKGQLPALPARVPEELRLVVEIATARDREDRFPTHKDMIQALARAERTPIDETEVELSALVLELCPEAAQQHQVVATEHRA